MMKFDEWSYYAHVRAGETPSRARGCSLVGRRGEEGSVGHATVVCAHNWPCQTLALSDKTALVPETDDLKSLSDIVCFWLATNCRMKACDAKSSAGERG
jgi:hypothetical protein